jgi:outer membrane biosynthesis protein TonB
MERDPASSTGPTQTSATAMPVSRLRRVLGRGSAAVVVLLVLSAVVTAQEADAPGRASGDTTSTQDYETLRKLLGLPSRVAPEAEPASEPFEEEPEPEFEPVREIEPEVRETAPKKSKPAVPKPAPVKKAAKPTPVAAPKPVAPPRGPAVVGQPAPAVVEQPAPTPPVASVPSVEIPPSGTIVSAKNMERWKHLLGPSIQWAIGHGASLPVVDAQPAPLEPSRLKATERYSAQVKLSPDKRSMVNYVAGIPFPHVTPDDPDVAIKVVFNFEARTGVDDLDLRKSSCDTCALSDRGIRVEKHYLSDHLRRLFYVGRLHQEPLPTWKTQEGFRYREMVAGLLEPFDLKGAGYTYARYLDPNRQDDSWVYYPSSRRVRRLSTAQRSEGVFGTDIDLDSFAGYAGNPAWAE